jgi:hypothetical protein
MLRTKAGGPVRQPYAGVDYISNLATGVTPFLSALLYEEPLCSPHSCK